MTMREYLSREAQRITDRSLAQFTDAAAWRRLIPEKRRQFAEMMGLTDLPPQDERPPLNPVITGVLERPGYRIEKLYFESLPQLYVTANLYVPEPLTAPAPGVLYVCGHAQHQKVHYQAHPRRFAQLGFACLVVETVQLGEVEGVHHGCYNRGWFDWYSRGYTSAGIELLNGIRGLDLLQERSDVDGARLGVTGISGGGATSWWVAAGDERIKVSAPVCGTATLASHITDRTIDGHCDCMWWINTYLWDLMDVGALIAPRPLMIASADRDGIFTIESIRACHDRLAGLYAKLGVPENLTLIETPGPHSYHERSRTAIFSWFLKHLQGKDVPPAEVGDIDDRPEAQETVDALRVYGAGSPEGNRTLTIHDELIPVATPPAITGAASLKRERRAFVRNLRAHTFRAFPARPPALDAQVTQRLEDNGWQGLRFAFTSEKGYRLRGKLTMAQDLPLPAPAVAVIRGRNAGEHTAEGLAGRLPAAWAKIILDPRGTGDTAWDEALSWHVRRAAAWTGRTLASMQVWDVLRGLEAVRALSEVQPDQVALAARADMCAVALYAALLDGRVSALILDSPPATQNVPSQPDGKGPAIEMLNCLRYTDLAQVAGLLWPTELVIAGECPETYEWAREVYRRLGEPGKLGVVADLGEWRPR